MAKLSSRAGGAGAGDHRWQLLGVRSIVIVVGSIACGVLFSVA